MRSRKFWLWSCLALCAAAVVWDRFISDADHVPPRPKLDVRASATDGESGIKLSPLVWVVQRGKRDPAWEVIPGYERWSLAHLWPHSYTGIVEISALGYSTQRFVVAGPASLHAVLVDTEGG